MTGNTSRIFAPPVKSCLEKLADPAPNPRSVEIVCKRLKGETR
jgi:hypothetical protein